LKINKSSITSGDKILLVDEWIETGTQMKVAIQLIEQLNGEIVDITTLCAETNKNTLVLFDKYNLHAISVSAEME
jgi:adenine phosphoribosyltransferase